MRLLTPKTLFSSGFLFLLPLLGGCEFLLFDPKGPIAAEQKSLIIQSFLIMMIVVIPVLIMTVAFPRKYNDNNIENEYKPDWAHSTLIEIVVWSVPLAIIIVLATVTYKTSHSLDPRQALSLANYPELSINQASAEDHHKDTTESAAKKETLRVHVIALDWKWLFIYPEQGIASVNELAIPINTPIEFLITSDTVMNSFFIPQLGSMIYAMAGMENQLHLIADTAGVYKGFSSNYSGFGFSGMKFKTHALSEANFNNWISDVKKAPEILSNERYKTLKQKSKDHPVEQFSKVNPLFFNRIIESYTGQNYKGQKNGK